MQQTRPECASAYFYFNCFSAGCLKIKELFWAVSGLIGMYLNRSSTDMISLNLSLYFIILAAHLIRPLFFFFFNASGCSIMVMIVNNLAWSKADITR